MKIKKIFLTLAIFGFLTAAASALAINSKTHLGLFLNSTAPFVTSASPSINSTITPQGVLSNQQTIVSTTTPIANGVVELWDVTASKSITTTTTNNDGKYQAILKIICNNTFKMEARFAGTSDYLPETSNQVTVTPTGGSPCTSGQDPYQVVSTTPPTATGSSGSLKDYQPLVQIPGVDTGNFLNYLRGMYNFLISIVGILAMASLVYGGFRYLTSVGNPAAVEDAKDIINSAIIGLVLALSSWLILNEINPDVLVLKKPGQIGALQGKYAYGETSNPCTQSPEPNVALGNECTCADGEKVKANPSAPAPSLSGGSFCNQLCSNPSLADDGKNHCGAKFLRVKLDTATTTNDKNFYYLDPKNSEMWDFFLTNKGVDDVFNVKVSSYTAGGVTYDCAILITDENTAFSDNNKVIWVKAGATVSSTSGNSLEKDIGKDNYNDTCPGNVAPAGDPACRLTIGLSFYDITTVASGTHRGAVKIFKSKYSSVLDYCESKNNENLCSFAKSRVEYIPSKSIICDPNIKAWRSL